MKDLSLHILDILENSVRACSKNIELEIVIDRKKDLLVITIEDDGDGMDEETLQKALTPFFTTKSVRNIGMGIPLFKAAAERAGGSFQIRSEKGKGTKIVAQFQWSHIDRQPLGDISSAVTTILMSNPEIDIKYSFKDDDERYYFDSREIKSLLEGVSISEPEVIQFVRKMIREHRMLTDEFDNGGSTSGRMTDGQANH